MTEELDEFHEHEARDRLHIGIVSRLMKMAEHPRIR